MTEHRIPITQAEADALLATVECPACDGGNAFGGAEFYESSCAQCNAPDRPTHVTSPVPVAKDDEVVMVVEEPCLGECGWENACRCPDGRRERVVARARAADASWPSGTLLLCDVQKVQE